MNSKRKWIVYPAALVMMAALALTQTQTVAAQDSSSSGNTPRVMNGVQRVPYNSSEPSRMETEGAAKFAETRVDISSDGDVLAARRGVNRAFFDLTGAFADKDLKAVTQVWPTIPHQSSGALGKAFGYFKNVSRNFVPEDIRVNGETATVFGSYSGSFVSGATIFPSSGHFQATLRKSATRWTVSTLIFN